MAKQIGSQYRETLEEAGYKLVSTTPEGWVILADEDGKLEAWAKHDDHAGWTIEIDGIGYEFMATVGT